MHRDHGLGVLTDGWHWEHTGPQVICAAADPAGLVLTTSAGIVLHRTDGTDVLLLDAEAVPSRAWPPAGAVRLPSGDLALALPAVSEVLVVTPQGRVSHRLGAAEGLQEPMGLCAEPDGNGFLVADARAHVVLHVAVRRATARVSRVHGRFGWAGKETGLLNAPQHASFTRSGGVLISDTKNNRLLEIEDGAAVRVCGRTEAYTTSAPQLWHPRTAQEGGDGTLLVAEGRGGRLLRIGLDDSLDVLLGRCDVATTELVQPRGAHFSPSGSVWVADCHNDRVLRLTTGGEVEAVLPDPSASEAVLDWPRFATSTAGGVVVADGRQSRLLFLDRDGTPQGTLSGWRPRGAGAVRPFGDPHHVVVTSVSPLEMLVTDSDTGTVVRMDRRGNATWWHEGLTDPHMALPLPDGAVLVCDTGADRLVRVSQDGRRSTWLGPEEVRAATGRPLRQPRAMARLNDTALLVVDTGQHRVLYVGPDGGIRSLSPLLEHIAGSLFFPRYVDVDRDERTMLLSDFDNSRLVFVHLPSLLGEPDE
ncbi:NHL repeat-containing protein [Streptomyces sp. NBC_00490]|uniref:NHL repeat-containing protein n=1 Tax=Streptomyces sp. NBC_00490 TaxID=2903657 RepID=UPI002E1732D3